MVLESALLTGTAEGEGLVGLALPLFFAWVDFLRLQMPGIMYEFYHLKKQNASTFVYSLHEVKGSAQLRGRTSRETLATSKSRKLRQFI